MTDPVHFNLIQQQILFGIIAMMMLTSFAAWASRFINWPEILKKSSKKTKE
jgi:hypothetical protein